jgi:beta-1,4-mannosyl-glycoprotein beta-1,4-N-acetylglucosaminyltransferase
MIYDLFPFSYEFDMLELRLRELDEVVDWFIVVEFDITYAGTRKPLNLRGNMPRYAKWKDKLVYHPVRDYIVEGTPYERQRAYRDYAKTMLLPDSGDIITYTDLDEIPRCDVYRRFDPSCGLAALDMEFYTYYINGKTREPWRKGRICSGDYWNSAESLDSMRFDTEPTVVIPNAGWHFSWLGNAVIRARKAKGSSHGHDPYMEHWLEALKKNPTPCFGPGEKTYPVEIDGTWPRTILANLEYYRQLGWVYDVDTGDQVD